MSSMTRLFGSTLVLTVALSGCSKDPAATVTPDVDPGAHHPHGESPEGEGHHGEGHDGGGHHEGKGGKHEHDFAASVKDFHDHMAPLWHADEGDARLKSTCDAKDGFVEKAKAVVADEVPEAAADKADEWKSATEGLAAASDALVAACDADGGDVAGALKSVHEAFHALLPLLGQEH